MTFATTATVPVARALQDELVAIGTRLVRRNKPNKNADTQISPGVIAGIAIGCASFVLLAILAVVVPILYIRYLKRLDKLKRSKAASDALNPHDDLHQTLQPQTSLRHNMIITHSPSSAWGALSSQEDVSEGPFDEPAQQEQRKPSLLSWPHSKKSWKKKRPQAKKGRQTTLSAIFENHQTDPGVEPEAPMEAETAYDDAQTPLQDELTSEEIQEQREATAEAMTASASQSYSLHGRSPSDTFSASDLIPTSDDGDRAAHFSPYRVTSRISSTMFASFANFSQETGLDNPRPQTEERRTSRASSLRSKIGTAPDEPLPPLPSNVDQFGPRAQDNSIQRESAISTSTIDSTATSIMDPPSPQSVDDPASQRQEPTTTNAESLDGKIGNEIIPSVARDPLAEHNDVRESRFASLSSYTRNRQLLSHYETQRYSMGSRNNRPRAKTATSLPEGDVAEAISADHPASADAQVEAVPDDPTSKRSSQIRKSKSAGDLIEAPNSVSGHNQNSAEDGESVQHFVQTLGAGSSPGSLFQWVMQAVSRKASPKSSPGPAKRHNSRALEQPSVLPMYTTAPFNTLPYRRINHIQEEAKANNASQIKHGGTAGPKPSLEEGNLVGSRRYHSHQTSSTSKSPDHSFEASDDLREGTDTTVSNSTPNGGHNKSSSNDLPSRGRTSSASEDAVDMSRHAKNANSRPIWSSSPGSSNVSEVTWSSSPPLPRNQVPLPSTHSKTTSASRFSYLPVASMSQPKSPPGSRLPRKPNYGPPRSQPSTTPPATRVLRPMTADARINRSHMRGYQNSVQTDQQSNSERFSSHDRDYGDDKENDRYRRGGGVWAGLDDLEDFWGTSEKRGRTGMFVTNKKVAPHPRTGKTKPVSRERPDTGQRTPSDDAEGDTSFEDENHFF